MNWLKNQFTSKLPVFEIGDNITVTEEYIKKMYSFDYNNYSGDNAKKYLIRNSFQDGIIINKNNNGKDIYYTVYYPFLTKKNETKLEILFPMIHKNRKTLKKILNGCIHG
jgi:hypothetical protein